MAPFFTGAIILLDIEHVLFPSNKLLSRDQYQALRLATVVHVDIYTTTTSSSIIVENFIPNLWLK